MTLSVRSPVVLLVLVAGLLTACTGSPEGEPTVDGGVHATTGAGAIGPDQDASTTDAGEAAPTTDPTDAGASTGPGAGTPDSTDGDGARPGMPGEVSAQLQSDGSILVDGDQASFLMPSQNVACLVRTDNVVCQIDGKEYDARSVDIDPAAFAGCTPAEADAMTVGGGVDPRWSCLPYDLRADTEVTGGGAWSGPGLGASATLDGATVAVLPYGTTLRLGNISCTSDRQGVTCTDLTTGHGFQLASQRYAIH